jgi:uncharacterized protein (DUF885 family)
MWPFYPTLFILIGLVTCPFAAAQDASRQLHDLLEREWDWQMQQHPTWASSLGDRRWNDRWTDMSPQAHQARTQHQRGVLKELQQIERSALSAADQLNFDLFRRQYEQQVRESEFGWDLLPLNQRGGLQTQHEMADHLRFETVKDYEDFLRRLQTFDQHVDQTIQLMRVGISRGIVHPKIIMHRVPAQIDRQIVADPTKSGFYKPFTRFPVTLGQPDRERLSRSASRAIEERVIPAYVRFKQFFENEYLPACLNEVGVWQLPEGEAMYAFFARRHTTTDLTPEEIHQLGLSEVARIRGQMLTIMDEVSFRGTLDEFFTFLRTDRQFFYATGEELLEATRAMCKRIDPHLVKLFRTMPRMPYGVEPIPEAAAPDTTTAYYMPPAADGSRAGTYYVNLYRPETRPKWEMMALSLHEAVPGHHLQISLAMELGEVPRFRRYGGGHTAYVEGWGLYSEALGDELGLYDDPYSKFGQLTYEMWRAVRLVVDTGIHHKRWTRQQAIDYFRANAPKSEHDITNEIDRYIAWPGQALAYKVGELKIRELRARATTELGNQFDVKAFHEVVLGSGPLPLDVLEQNVDTWVRQGGPRE